MVEPGENVSETLRKEFTEEALAKLAMEKEQRDELSARIDMLFSNGVEVCIMYCLFLVSKFIVHYVKSFFLTDSMGPLFSSTPNTPITPITPTTIKKVTFGVFCEPWLNINSAVPIRLVNSLCSYCSHQQNSWSEQYGSLLSCYEKKSKTRVN